MCVCILFCFNYFSHFGCEIPQAYFIVGEKKTVVACRCMGKKVPPKQCTTSIGPAVIVLIVITFCLSSQQEVKLI